MHTDMTQVNIQVSEQHDQKGKKKNKEQAPRMLSFCPENKHLREYSESRCSSNSNLIYPFNIIHFFTHFGQNVTIQTKLKIYLYMFLHLEL